MRSTRFRPALLAVVLAATLAAGCGDDDGDDEIAEPATETTAGSDGGSGDAVAVAGFAFSPDTLTVAPGTTVTWTNEDSTTHTVTADDAGTFDSGDLDGGATFEHTFDDAGTFAYHCEIHPSMTGEVVVEG